jgi:hypothetical protein
MKNYFRILVQVPLIKNVCAEAGEARRRPLEEGKIRRQHARHTTRTTRTTRTKGTRQRTLDEGDEMELVAGQLRRQEGLDLPVPFIDVGSARQVP